MDEKDNKPTEEPVMDFFKHMDDIIKKEAARDAAKKAPEPDLTPNQEYQRRYGRSVSDRVWIGPQRYR